MSEIRSLEEDHGQAGRRETIEEKVVRMYQVLGRCHEGRISGELENYSPFSQRGKGRGEEERVESSVAGGVGAGRSIFIQTRGLGYLPGAVQE